MTRTDLERFPEVDFFGFFQAEWNHGHDRLGAETNQQELYCVYIHIHSTRKTVAGNRIVAMTMTSIIHLGQPMSTSEKHIMVLRSCKTGNKDNK